MTLTAKTNIKQALSRLKKTLITITILFLSQFYSAQTILNQEYSFAEKTMETYTRKSMAQQGAVELSFIGEYDAALKMWDINSLKMPGKLSPEQAAAFASYNALSAREFIRQQAATKQIIIINEAHHQPYHRVFTTSLLHDLYNAGFRYFGAETITNSDSTIDQLKKHKFPLLTTGYYTKEPFYGNLIREAINEGYTIFGYETTRSGNTDSAGINLREIDQAKNIKKILDKDPNAKIVIHCGWDHIVESPYNGWGMAMAGRLFEYTGIDPLTIDQTRLTEHSSADYHNPYWTSTTLDYDAVFVDSAGVAFYGPPENKQYDVRVYHPKTRWTNGRPGWVFDNNRIPVSIDQTISVKFPCLVFAFITNELKASNDAIPFDIIELHTPQDKKALSLKKDQTYTIILMDTNSKIQTFEIKAR